MPELPEVETVTQGLAQVIKGLVIQTAKTYRPDLRVPFPPDLEARLCDLRVLDCSRRAKYSLVHLSGGLTLVFHLGMSGRISLPGPQEHYQRAKHDHLLITFENGQKLVLNDARRFGMVYLIHTGELEAHKAFSHLGPEPLGKDFTPAYLRERLKGRKTPVKVAILDQRVVVGVGNIYICEALYRAGIAPDRAAGSLASGEIAVLVQAIRDVLEEAIAAGGSSLKDYRHTDGTLGYFQHRFAVYNREGEGCGGSDGGEASGCGDQGCPGVRRIVQAGRSTFYCPARQK